MTIDPNIWLFGPFMFGVYVGLLINKIVGYYFA